MFVDDQWCLSCSTLMTDSKDPYCSIKCRQVDNALPLASSLPVAHAEPSRPKSPPPTPAFEHLRQLEASARPSSSTADPKTISIIAWVSRVEAERGDDAPDSDPSPPPSPVFSVSPRQSRFRLSASVVDPPRIQTPPRMLAPVDDLESLCPPTLALTAEDSLPVTPPSRSVAALPVVQTSSPELKDGWFDKYAHRLRSWRARDLALDECAEERHRTDDLLPVGVEAATFYQTCINDADDDLPEPAHPRAVPIAVPRRSPRYNLYCFDAADNSQFSACSSELARGRARSRRAH